MKSPTLPRPSQPLRTVIAEDDDFIRGFFVRVVRRMGHEVIAETPSGRELVELCLPLKPDLLITNIRLQEMNGLDAIAALGRVQPTRTIIISAEDPAATQDPQVVDYLIKPIKLEELVQAIACFENSCAHR